MDSKEILAEIRRLWSCTLNIPEDGASLEDTLLGLGANSFQVNSIYTSLQSPPWSIKHYPHTPFLSWSLGQHMEFVQGRLEKTKRDALLRKTDGTNLERIPLSYPQEQIWFQLQDSASPLIYNYSSAFQFPGTMNVQAMEKSVNLLVARHQTFRTTFQEAPGKILQEIKAYVPFKLVVQDLRHQQSPLECCQSFLKKNLEEILDLRTGPLITFTLLLISPELSILHVVGHHIVVDGTTGHLIELELRTSYDLFSRGKDPGDTPPKIEFQYSDFVFWQREVSEGGGFSKFFQFWKEYLKNVPPLELSRDGARVPSIGMLASSVRFKWSGELTKLLAKFSKGLKVTPFVVILAAVNVVLGRYANQDDVSILTAKHGRTNSKLRSIMGHFINSIVVRTKLEGGLSFADLVRQTDINLTNVYENQEYPFQSVVQDLIRESGGKLFQYLLFPVCIVMIPKLVRKNVSELTSYIDIENRYLTHELTFYFEEGEEELGGYVKYNPHIHSRARIMDMVSSLEIFMGNSLKTPKSLICDLDILGSTRVEHILTISRGRQVPIEESVSLITLLEKQISRTPKNIALIEGDMKLSYEDLNSRSNSLTTSLTPFLELSPFVAILLPQSVDNVIANIGILKRGKCVVPLSVQNSKEYLIQLLRELEEPLLVTKSEILDSLALDYDKVFLLDRNNNTEEIDPANYSANTKSCPIAYCIHTSGSTGKPKPVVITHASLINHATWARDDLHLTESDCVLLFNNVAFDASLQDIWPFLLSGGTLCVPPPNVKYQLHSLWAFISCNHVTCLTLPTAIGDKVLSQAMEADLAGTPLRILLCGGEDLHSWRPGLPFQVVNGYGLTECTIISTFVFLDEDNFPCSGHPISNTQVFVLNESGKLQPVGVSGEIYVSGAGVSSYWNRDALNKEKFLPNPFPPGNLMYRTGDLGYWGFDGNLCIVGRIDAQVKVRGHRIELGEIEKVVISWPGILEAVVMVEDDSLTAYARLDLNFGYPGFIEFQIFLKERLPYYAIPSRTYILSSGDFPLNPNGKIDRKILLESRDIGLTLLTPEFNPVRNEVEALVSTAWAEILGLQLDEIGREDNFFALGGHSLLVAEVIYILQEENGEIYNLQVEDLFKEPTVRGLASLISSRLEKNKESSPSLEPVPFAGIPKYPVSQEDKIPLTFQQQQIWLHMQENSSFPALYNEAFSMDLNGKFGESQIINGLQTIISRHDILRSNYREDKGEPVFTVGDASKIKVQVEVKHLARISRNELDLISRRILQTNHRIPFNLEKDMLIRFTILRLDDSLIRLQVVFHHLVMDAIGILVFERELRILLKDNVEKPLASLELQYTDYALWQNSSEPKSHNEASAFWKTFLQGLEPINLFTQKQRKHVMRSESGSLGFNLSPELTLAIRSFCVENNTTPFVTLFACLNLLISRYSGQEDVFSVCTTSGRTVKGLDALIGYFVNMVIFRNEVSKSTTFQQLVHLIHSNQNKVLEFQDYPFQNVVRDVGLKLGEDLLRIGVTMEPRNTKEHKSSFFFEEIDYTSKFELLVCFDELAEGLKVYLVYNRSIYSHSEMNGFGSHYLRLLEQALKFQKEPVGSLDFLTDEERQLVLSTFNEKRAPKLNSANVTLTELFRAQVEKTPDNVAIVENGVGITYQELNEKVQELRLVLQNRKTIGEFIAILLPQSTEFILSSIAILMEGKICVPLSVDYPKKQLEYMLDQVGNPVLISRTEILEKSGLLQYSNALKIEHLDSGDLDPHFNADVKTPKSYNAYCLFTSGSTGLPKPVLLENAGILNYSSWFQSEYEIKTKDRGLVYACPAFDFSLAEIWPFLCCGASVFIPPYELRYNVTLLHDWIVQNKLTYVFLTTRLCEAFFPISDDCGCLKLLVCAGEALHAHPPASLNYPVSNCYGTTETSIISTVNNLRAGAVGVPSVGTPITNVRVYVLDPLTLMPMPVGVAGEVFIGGVGVTPGYLNRDSLNADKLIRNPYASGRMYKTGDIGYWTSSGELVIVGRKDNQIKVRGIRIGLGQIEDTLMEFPGIKQAVVIVTQDIKISAYCVVSAKPELKELRDFLKQHLPLYAIPSAILFLTSLPLTTNGKVDKVALTTRTPSENEFITDFDTPNAPKTKEELIVAQVWSKVLRIGVEEINVESNFFSLGGHSMLVASVISNLAASPWFIKLQIADVFNGPTVQELAKRIVESKSLPKEDIGAMTLMTSSGQDKVKARLSFQQEQIWYHMQEGMREGKDSLYNETFSLNFDTKLDVGLFRRAIQLITNRHGILRTNFVEENGNVFQVIRDPIGVNDVQVEFLDLIQVGDPGRKDTISRDLLNDSQAKKFDLSYDPLLRYRLIHSIPKRNSTRVQVIFHHLILDAIGIIILEKELRHFYEVLQGNTTESELPVQYQYADFAEWQRESFHLEKDKFQESKVFWQKYLEGLEPLELFPKQRQKSVLDKEYQSGTTGVTLSAELTKELKTFTRSKNTTLFVVLLSALKLLIHRYTGQEDVFIACSAHGRNHPELEDMVGYFVNMLLFRNDLSGNPSFSCLVQRVQRNTTRVLEHQDFPFVHIAAATGLKAKDVGLFNIGLTIEPRNYRGVENESTFFFERIEPATKFDLLIGVDENGDSDGIQIGFLYNRNVYSDEAMNSMVSHLKSLLEFYIPNPNELIGSFNFLSNEETIMVIQDFNEQSLDIPMSPYKSLAEAFLVQADAFPKNTCICDEVGKELNYAEVKVNVLRLKKLIQLKGGQNSFVALLLPQSEEYITSSLAILCAGKICSPLGVEYPPKLLEYMLGEIGNPLMITTTTVLQSTGLSYSNILLLDKLETFLDIETMNVKYPTTAYCMFTSGSTGNPKPVLVEHAGIINCATWLIRAYDFQSTERSLLVGYPAFDLSLAEVWPFLLAGGALYIPPNDTRYDIRKMQRLISKNRITVMFLTTKLGEEFFRLDNPEGPSSLRWVFTGGEAISAVPPKNLPYRICYGYGNTETSIITTLSNDPNFGLGNVSIGKPIGNVRVYVLDPSSLNPLPVGVVGEVFIGGVGVTPGYLNREEDNLQKIIPDPYANPNLGRQMYKSGDLGYWGKTGHLFLVGRRDAQVKIRGTRIGLGQVEEALVQYSLITQAIVILEEDKSLTAFCISSENQIPQLHSLLEFLNGRLPRNAVPSKFAFLPNFPLTPSGKVDKKILKERLDSPETQILKSEDVQASTVEERLVAQVWSEVLKIPVESICAGDNFFALGGHSLLVTEVVQELQDNFLVKVSDVFMEPMLCRFAAKLIRRTEGSTDSQITPRKLCHTSRIPLSFPQEQIWLHSQAQSQSMSLYTVSFNLEFRDDSPVDTDAVVGSLDCVLHRHEILASTIHEEDGELYQSIHNPSTLLSRALQSIDLSNLVKSKRRSRTQMQEAITAKIFRKRHLEGSFDLENGPLIRLSLLKLSSTCSILLGSCHHAIMDGMSVQIVQTEIRSVYQKLRIGGDISQSLLPLRIQYSDYVFWQRENSVWTEDSRNFWLDYLNDVIPLQLRTDRPRDQPGRKYKASAHKFDLGVELSSLILEFSRCHKGTAYMTLLALVKHLFYRYTGQSDLFLISTTDGRPIPELQNLIGHFVNMLILRTKGFSDELTFSQIADAVYSSTTQAYQYQATPLQTVISQTGLIARDMGLYRFGVTMGTSDQNSMEVDTIPDMDSKYELFISIHQSAESYHFLIWFDTDLYDRVTVGRLAENFKILTRNALNSPDKPVGNLGFIGDEERNLVLHTFNQPSKVPDFEYPRNSSLIQLFEQQVKKSPGQVAILTEDKELTYVELNIKAEAFKNFIFSRPSVVQDNYVAILLPQSIDFVATSIAILKGGKVCVPLNVDTPIALLIQILQEVGSPALISSQEILSSKEFNYPRVIDVTSVELQVSSLSDSSSEGSPLLSTSTNPIAYCLCTSGSTGIPKTILLSHSALINFATWIRSENRIEPTDRSLLFSSPAFDMAVNEIWGYLPCGATLCIPPPDIRYDVKALRDWIVRMKVTIVVLTTRIAEKFLELEARDPMGSGGSLRIIHFGGEAFNADTPIPTNTSYIVSNGFGVTEGTLISSLAYITPHTPALPIIGKPIWNVQLYVLSKQLEPLPIGVTGEICLGGAGVSPGYLNRADLNRRKFVPDHFTGDGANRLYRTGDLGYWLPSGDIVIVGREDDQIKIRGFRINLGQIERAICQHAGVAGSVVLQESPNSNALTAYFVQSSNSSREELGLNELRNFLARSIPQFAIPAQFFRVMRFPLNPTGKIDKVALLGLKLGGEASQLKTISRPPGTMEEKLVAEVWQQILEISGEGIDVDDNFFSLGGHSLLATAVIQQLSIHPGNYAIKVADIFRYPILSEFAALLSKQPGGAVARIKRRDSPAKFSLSYAQEQVWMHLQDIESTTLYNVGFCLEFNENVDCDALRRSIAMVMERHEILRITIHESGGIPFQEIKAMEDMEYSPKEIDLSGVNPENQRSTCETLALTGLRTPFDLANGPLIKFHLMRMSENYVKLFVFSHHLVLDGRSVGIFTQELKTCYELQRTNGPNLESLPVRYSDFVLWQRETLGRGGMRPESEAFWKEYLNDLSALEFQTDCPRASRPITGAGMVTFEIGDDLTKLLRSFSNSFQSTSFATLFSIMAVLVYRYTKQSDFFVVSPVDGRSSPEIQNILGHFVNLVLFRVTNIRDELTFAETLRLVHDSIASVYTHMDSPFQSVIAQVGLNARELGLYRTVFSMTRADDLENVNNDHFQNMSSGLQPKFEFGVFIDETRDSFRVGISYAEPLYGIERVQRFAGHFKTLLEGILLNNAEGMPIGKLNFMTEDERNQLLYSMSFASTQQQQCRGQSRSLIGQFVEQMSKYPEKIALFDETEGSLTYTELYQRGLKLAASLEPTYFKLGNDFICILLPTGSNAVISLITSHMLGGTYAPINVRSPHDQIRSILNDLSHPIVLTTRAALSNLKLDNIELENFFFVEDVLPRVGEADLDLVDQRPLTLYEENKPPYCLFTSGSTGKPKAVLLTQLSILNLIEWMRTEFQLSPKDRALDFYSHATDGFLAIFWSVITSGGTAFIPPDDMHYDMDSLRDWVFEKQITLIGMPTASAEKFYSSTHPHSTHLKWLLCGGEPMKILPPSNLPFAVVNCYGLTETGVICIFARAHAAGDEGRIVIGRPIQNTLVYILDEYFEPVPIGVRGELYIGGDCIAQSYFKDARLNLEKFIRNPFSDSGRLFRTGDLGYWLLDGNICLSGRCDNLVKIRSNRVELDGVESCLLSYGNIGQVAVLTETSAQGETTLVAYCVKSNQADHLNYTDLHSYLRERLPLVAIPTAIYTLPNFPLNNNGKVDRKSLASLKTTTAELVSKGADGAMLEPPKTKEEISVVQIWAKVLKIPAATIGRRDNFFALGGNSLLLAEIIAEYNQRNTKGTSALTISTIFTNPTVLSLAKYLENSAKPNDIVEELSIDFRKETLLGFEVDKNLELNRSSDILITGATGYLGSGLLIQLLHQTDAIIYCLIRAGSLKEAQSKLLISLAPHSFPEKILEKRVFCLPGNLTLTNFGLNATDYGKLSEGIGSIYHCAAEVHFLKTYAELRSANVEGTREILKFATKCTLKTLHYVSTLGVFSSRLENNNNIVISDEVSLDDVRIDPHSFTSGYGQSKWVAETLVWAAVGQGLPAVVYRPGEIGCHEKMRRYNETDMVAIVLKTCDQLGFLPDINGSVPYGTLDFCASAIVSISLVGRREILNKAFHIMSHCFTLEELFGGFRKYRQLPVVEFAEWETRFKDFLAKATGEGCQVRCQAAVLSLMLTNGSSSKEFRKGSYPLQTIRFSNTERALGISSKNASNLEAIQRYINCILGN